MHKSPSSQLITRAIPMSMSEMFSGDKIVPWNIDDLEATVPCVPVQQAIVCGSTHSFPLSLLDPTDDHDARSVAACLVTPSIREPEERIENTDVLRRIVNLDAVYRRRILMHRIMMTRQSKY